MITIFIDERLRFSPWMVVEIFLLSTINQNNVKTEA
jgi:hypothetical protein